MPEFQGDFLGTDLTGAKRQCGTGKCSKQRVFHGKSLLLWFPANAGGRSVVKGLTGGYRYY